MTRKVIEIRGPRVHASKNDMKVSLTLRFNPEDLGSEKTGRLIAGLFNAVADVVTPAERAEMLRQLDAERARLARTA
jgi:hypothetical protein